MGRRDGKGVSSFWTLSGPDKTCAASIGFLAGTVRKPTQQAGRAAATGDRSLGEQWAKRKVDQVGITTGPVRLD